MKDIEYIFILDRTKTYNKLKELISIYTNFNLQYREKPDQKEIHLPIVLVRPISKQEGYRIFSENAAHVIQKFTF